MKAEIIAAGSELVSGQKLDTNSRLLSRRLEDLGIGVRFHTAVGDDLDETVSAFRIARERADLVIVGGGLGPTQDDLTREALARLANAPLREDPESLRSIRLFFARRHREMPERNRVQALLPEGAEMLPNRVGTAPGVWLRCDETTFVCLPGVPYELSIMFEEQAVPRLKASGWANRTIVHHVIHLFGRGESDIEAEALDLTVRGRVPEVGITASDATISFRVSAEGADEEKARALMEPTLREIRRRFDTWIVGEGDETVADGLVAQLRRTGATIALAESCTGGLIAQKITAIPGVSAYFPGGVVCYSNDAKVDLLGVPRELIERFGAVSPQTAEALAQGARERFRSDIAIGVTGIAGPDGGTEEKPVGLVHLGLATAEGTANRKLELGPEQPRSVIQSRAAQHALNWARLYLRENRGARI